MRQSHGFPPRLIGLLVALTLGWGFNWPVMKIALSGMAPMHFRTWCLATGAIGLFAIARANGFTIRIPEGQFARLLAIALVNMTCWNVFAIYGLPLLPSGRAAILGYTMPVWSVPLSIWLLKEPISGRRVLGMVLGVAGMLALLGSELQAVEHSPLGVVLLMGAAFSWALGTVMIKRWPVSLPATSFTAWQMALGGIPIFVVAFFIESGSFDLLALPTGPLLATLYNMVVAFIICFWAWITIARNASVGAASIAVLMTPVVGVFSGMLLLGEEPRWLDYLALVLVVLSIATVVLPERRSATGRDMSAS
ncbi:MAG: EamA family transporter [Betaproteobacteria bacterium]|nr:EamA family transporter [Betaproteobacteria bacterium]